MNASSGAAGTGCRPHDLPKGGGTPRVSPARRVAFEILMLVAGGKGHSDELLHSARTQALTPEDRNLATALVMGVLRWQIALDARIRRLLQRPEQRLAEPVALALRMGAFQLLHMDRIPAHAALSESVELCKVANEPHAAGMVNAILRKLAAAQRPGTRLHESVPALAERLGHPHWLVERWVAGYGREAARAICEAGQREPGDGALFAGTEMDLPQIDDGSRLVAELAAVALAAGGTKIWDCCAAPGGKTLVLAHRCAGAEVLATDISGRRVAQMEARLRRHSYAAAVRCEVEDATAAAAAGAPAFDRVLCDVPCSGTGTLGRNPEIRHLLRSDDLARQAARQRALLRAAYARLAPGGRLVYSTCSLEPEENERTVASLDGAVRMPVAELIQRLGERGILTQDAVGMLLATGISDGALRTLPGVHPCDGFFAVVLHKPG